MLIPAVIALIVSVLVAARLKPDATERLEPPATLGHPPSGGLSPAVFFRDVFPLGAGVLISALYFRIDVYFIERWLGLEAVGGYNAVFRLVEAMRLLPAAVMAVTFPLLVQSADMRLVQRIGAILTVAGIALALVCALGASTIVPLIYGQPYLYAAPAFAILALALPLFYLNYALTHQVIGWDGQRAYLVIATVALVGNVIANIALVPSRGIVGASIATVLTEVIVTAGCLIALANLRIEPAARTIVSNQRVEQAP
jgi:O-antigen/teichoic acid export membrane protein